MDKKLSHINPALRRTTTHTYHYIDGVCIEGPPPSVKGDLTGVRGDLTGVRGDIDECNLTSDDRERGIDVSELIGK